MSKDIEEEVKYKLIQLMEEKKRPKETMYPKNSKDKEKEKEMREQIDKIM